jgi:magnesium-transporting ATPase (P-type)
MTTRAVFVAMKNYLVTDPSQQLGDYVKTFEGGASSEIIKLIGNLVAICTMDESVLFFDKNDKVEGGSGNPTEVALLNFVNELGLDYEAMRIRRVVVRSKVHWLNFSRKESITDFPLPAR